MVSRKLIGFRKDALDIVTRRARATGQNLTAAINDLILGADRYGPLAEELLRKRMLETGFTREAVLESCIMETLLPKSRNFASSGSTVAEPGPSNSPNQAPSEPIANPPLAVSVREAAKRLGISRTTMWKLCATGKIRKTSYGTIAIRELERHLATEAR